MNLAKDLKEEQVEGASNDNPQGSQVDAAEGALASDPCTRVTRDFSLACPDKAAEWSPSRAGSVVNEVQRWPHTRERQA